MIFLKIAAGTIFNLLGLIVLFRGIREIREIRQKGLGEGFVDIFIGLGFLLIGLLIWTGFIS